jgi:hypothetical protein
MYSVAMTPYHTADYPLRAEGLIAAQQHSSVASRGLKGQEELMRWLVSNP